MERIFCTLLVFSLLVRTLPFGSGLAETPKSKNAKVTLAHFHYCRTVLVRVSRAGSSSFQPALTTILIHNPSAIDTCFNVVTEFTNAHSLGYVVITSRAAAKVRILHHAKSTWNLVVILAACGAPEPDQKNGPVRNGTYVGRRR